MQAPRRIATPFYCLPACAGHSVNITGAAYPTVNKAFYISFSTPYDCVLASMEAHVSSGTGGTYDMGIYDGVSLAQLAALGSTSVSATGVKTFTFTAPGLPIRGGKTYLAALSHSGNTTQWLRDSGLTVVGGRMAGVYEQTTAHPLPNPAVPVPLSGTYYPVIRINVQGIRSVP